MNKIKNELSNTRNGCFFISGEVCNALINYASAAQICTYLALARYTDADGQFSTAGRNAVKNALGIGDHQADLMISSVLGLRLDDNLGNSLVLSAAEYSALGNDRIERPTLRSQVRFHLIQYESDIERVWFSNGLVDGYGKFTKPLKTLKRLGTTSARLLLFAYKNNAMEQFGGVPPYLLNRKYVLNDTKAELNGFRIWHAKPTNSVFVDQETISKINVGTPNAEESVQELSAAASALLAAGLLYEVVTVLESPLTVETSVVYELDARSRHGYKPKNEEGIAGLTAKLAGFLRQSVTTRGTAVFNGRYAVVVEDGVQPACCGIFRIRFRVSNPNNYTVIEAYRRIYDDQSTWKAKLEYLITQFERTNLIV